MAGNDDLLTSIINDPKKFLEVLKIMDTDGNKNIAPEEFIHWVKANADKLNVRGANGEMHNLAADLKTHGPKAATDIDKLTKDLRDPKGPNPIKLMEEIEAATQSRNTIQRDVRAVADRLQEAADTNARTLSYKAPAAANNIPDSEDNEFTEQQQKKFLDDVRSGKIKLNMSEAQKKNPKMTTEYLLKMVDQDARESAEMKAEEQRMRVVQDSPAVMAIREQAGKYQVGDLGAICAQDLQPLISAGKAPQPAKDTPKR